MRTEMKSDYKDIANKTQHKTIQVDLKNLPHRHDSTADNSLGYLALFFGVFWSIIPFFILIQKLSEPRLDFQLALVLGAFLTIGFGIISFSVHLLTSKRIITFHRNMVDIDTKNLLTGAKTKTLPYNAFKGVLMDEFTVHRENASDPTYQTITLVHEDKSLNVLLFETEGVTPPRALWKQYIQVLRVSGLQKDGSGYQVVTHDDLELSLQDRAKQAYGSQQDPSFSASDIPKGLEISKQNSPDGSKISLRISTNRLSLKVLVMFLVVPIVFMALAVLPTDVPIIFPIVGFLFFLLLSGMAVHDHNNKRKITISRSEISIADAQPQGKHEKTVTTLPLHAIENILIKGQSLNEHIVIIGKDGEISTGTGMSSDTLKWLQSYLRAAVVTA